MGHTEHGERFYPCKGDLPYEEFAFHTVPVAELKACLHHECRRERALSWQQMIMELARAIKEEGLQGKEEFNQLLELQDELDELRPHTRPWLLLKREDQLSKAGLLSGLAPKTMEPVCLLSELTPLQRWILRRSKQRENLGQITIDWSASNKELGRAFLKFVDVQRHKTDTRISRGPKEARGRKPSTQEQLLCVAVWRCRKAGLSPAATLDFLEPLRKGLGWSNRDAFSKKLKSMERRAEMMFGFPL